MKVEMATEQPKSDWNEAVVPDVRMAKDVLPVPKADHYLAIVTFTLLGCSQLLIWNFVISSFSAFGNYIWPTEVFSNLLGGVEHAMALFVAVVMLKFNGLSTGLCHLTGIANILLFAILPLVPTFLAAGVKEDHPDLFTMVDASNVVPAKAWLSVICVFLGLCSGLFHVFGFAFASITPFNYCGYVCTGQGVAGAMSFFVFTLLFSIFPRTQKGQINLLWAFFMFGAFCSLIQSICFFYLSKRDWFKQCVEVATKQHAIDAEENLKTFGPRRGIIAVFKDCWLQAFNASFTLFITLFLFPSVGPFAWHQTPDVSNLLNGTFQVLDLLLRWTPTLGGWTMLSKKTLFILTMVRPVLMIPLFILPSKIKGLPFLGDTWWLFILMGIFTITNGWIVSLGAMYCPECVEHPEEKEIASDIFVILMLVLVTAGIFSSYLVNIGT